MNDQDSIPAEAGILLFPTASISALEAHPAYCPMCKGGFLPQE